MQKLQWGLIVVCLGCLCSMTSYGQVAAPPGSTTGQGQLDQELAKCLVIDNRAEIAIAEFAQQKAQRSDVKEFAQRIAEDHKSLLDRLNQVSPSTGQQVTSQPGIPGQQRATGAQHGSQMLAIKQEVSDACVKAVKEDLGEKSSDEFDRCFIGQQICQHTHMLATLQVFERHAGDNLRSAIRNGIDVTEKHLAEAKKIMKGVESDLAQVPKSDRQSR